VVLGAFLTPLTQLYLEKKREQHAGNRAKLLVGGELLHAQLILRATSERKNWPPVEDVNAFLPTSAWQENRSTLADKVDEDLWTQLVMTYAGLEIDRARFVTANRIPSATPLTAEVAEAMKQESNKLSDLRKKLGIGGGWVDESAFGGQVATERRSD